MPLKKLKLNLTLLEELNKMSPQERSQDFLSDAEWDSFLDKTDQQPNPFAEAMWEMEKKKARQEQERNTRHSVDKSQEFINSGMTLITDPESDRYLNKSNTVSD
jgi:hypothetical protein|tara:strand:+ start:64 stop:375 length:312 start_codon:yes stop_codon:yes gene_type:complete